MPIPLVASSLGAQNVRRRVPAWKEHDTVTRNISLFLEHCGHGGKRRSADAGSFIHNEEVISRSRLDCLDRARRQPHVAIERVASRTNGICEDIAFIAEYRLRDDGRKWRADT